MSDYPERISISPVHRQKRDDDFYLVDRKAFPDKGVEYVRADIAQAAAADAMTKAALNLRTYAPCLVDGPEHDVGYYYGYHTALGRILDLLAELKGQDDD